MQKKKFPMVWRKWLKELRDKVPLSRPVVVKRHRKPIYDVAVGMPDDAEPVKQLGYAYLSNGTFRIGVDGTESRYTQLETLLHEWAHCVAFSSQQHAGTEWTHDDLFGIAYAYVYRTFYDDEDA